MLSVLTIILMNCAAVVTRDSHKEDSMCVSISCIARERFKFETTEKQVKLYSIRLLDYKPTREQHQNQSFKGLKRFKGSQDFGE